MKSIFKIVWKFLTKKRYLRECPQGGHNQIGSLSFMEQAGGYCRHSSCVRAMVVNNYPYVYRDKRSVIQMSLASYYLLVNSEDITSEEWYKEFGESMLKMLEECEE